MKNRERIIANYVEAYNNFDIAKMIADFSDDITFENIQNGEVTIFIRGIDAFKKQAEIATGYFSERTQIVQSFNHSESTTEIEIDYDAKLATDLPSGAKKGQTLQLKGKSVFEFDGDRVIKLTDIS